MAKGVNPKAAGQARKAETAAGKKAAEEAKKAAEEDAKWDQGAKKDNKKADAEAKKAEAARKKKERDEQLAEETASARAAPKNTKSAKGGGGGSKGTLDMGKLGDLDGDDEESAKAAALNASGIENALDALSLTKDANTTKVERHPERRYPAAYAAYEARRLPEIEKEHRGLRKNQRQDLCRREFRKHPDNPFNQTTVRYDATKEQIQQVKESQRKATEKALTQQ